MSVSVSERTAQQFSEVFHLASKEPRVDFAHVSIPALSQKEDYPADFSTRGTVAAGFLYGHCNGDPVGRVIADVQDGKYVPVAVILKNGNVVTPEGQEDTTGELAKRLADMRVRKADSPNARMG